MHVSQSVSNMEFLSHAVLLIVTFLSWITTHDPRYLTAKANKTTPCSFEHPKLCLFGSPAADFLGIA